MSHPTMTSQQLATALTLRDLSDPGQGAHAMQILMEELLRELSQELALPLKLLRPDPIVSVAANYDALRISKNSVSRNRRYTRYLDEENMLRSHMSAHAPQALKALDKSTLIALPGLVYRRDQVDANHVGEPHQMDIWPTWLGVGKTNEELLELRNAMLSIVAEKVAPARPWRLVATDHPYTLSGVQLDIQTESGVWLEVAEGGITHPALLKSVGIAGSGLAMGMGLDRAIMLRKGIEDIRWLRSPHEHALTQWSDLAPWRAISLQPAIRRNLSLMVQRADGELLGARVRECLSPTDGELLEELSILETHSAETLPLHVRTRLGATEGQVNILLSVTLRALTRTLDKDEATRIVEAIYSSLHEGTAPGYSNGAR